jgi:hypothetical protein
MHGMDKYYFVHFLNLLVHILLNSFLLVKFGVNICSVIL